MNILTTRASPQIRTSLVWSLKLLVIGYHQLWDLQRLMSEIPFLAWLHAKNAISLISRCKSQSQWYPETRSFREHTTLVLICGEALVFKIFTFLLRFFKKSDKSANKIFIRRKKVYHDFFLFKRQNAFFIASVYYFHILKPIGWFFRVEIWFSM